MDWAGVVTAGDAGSGTTVAGVKAACTGRAEGAGGDEVARACRLVADAQAVNNAATQSARPKRDCICKGNVMPRRYRQRSARPLTRWRQTRTTFRVCPVSGSNRHTLAGEGF